MTSSKSRIELAEQKRAFIRKLFEERPERSSNEVHTLVQEKFGGGAGAQAVLKVMHEVRGTKAAKRPQKKRKKPGPKPKPKQKSKPKSKLGHKPKPKAKSNGLVAIPVTVQTQSAGSSIEALCRALVRAMRDEGIESVTLRADGSGRAFQLVTRDLNVGV